MPARTKAGRPGGAGTRHPVPSPLACSSWGSWSTLPAAVLGLSVRSELAASFETTGSSSLRFLVISRDLFSRKPKIFNTVLVFIWKQSYPRTHWQHWGSWEAALYVSLFRRLSIWICLANTLSQRCSGLGFSCISCRILSREADFCDLHSAVRITLLVSARRNPESCRLTALCTGHTALPPSLEP